MSREYFEGLPITEYRALAETSRNLGFSFYGIALAIYRSGCVPEVIFDMIHVSLRVSDLCDPFYLQFFPHFVLKLFSLLSIPVYKVEP